ncbi:T9SS type A sorting domain-containing protein [candidate division KSB1 bacterium]|nr:T9SS type A sorting domain-containing protein [candidate division KSB1 bacterium]
MKKYLLTLCIISMLRAQDKHATDLFFLSKMPAAVEEINPIDVISYDVDMTLDLQNEKISGHVRMEIKLLDPTAPSFYIHLTTPRIAKAMLNGDEISFLHAADKVYFTLLSPAEDITLDIDYSGTPGNDGFGGFYFQDSYAYTIGQGLNSTIPSMLRHWIPSHDVPHDKATVDMRLTVPAALEAFANGSLVTSVTHNSTKTVHWRETHPIATYLIAIAVGHYTILRSTYRSISGDSIPLEFYVYPEHAAAAANDWKNLPQMMGFFEHHFAPYPFDRYSMAEAFNRGAMEHQTMTTYSYQLITGDNRYDYIMAHELAHHWWGDLVTLADWREIWLNEGFATYSEALYFESLYGDDYLAEYMNALLEIYLAEVVRRGHFPIYNPDYLWGGTIYQKGAWVLHMLRWTIGEDAFWRTLQSWAHRFAYGNAFITDFIRLAEEQSSQDLDWFFDQWIYQAGYPDFDIIWDYRLNDKRTWSVTIEIRQQQWQNFPFRAPIEIEFEFAGGSRLDTLISSAAYQTFQIELQNEPYALHLDPRNWLLKQYDLIFSPSLPDAQPNDFYLAQNYPNPFVTGSQTSIVYQVAQMDSPHQMSIQVYNILGQRVSTLFDGPLHGGIYKAVWDGKDMAGRTVPSGVYFYRLQSAEKTYERKLVILEK